MLEDLGYARVVPEEGGKKIYEITDEGRKHLAEHSTTVDDIFERISRFVAGFSESPMVELNHAFGRLARATYATATSHMSDKEKLEQIKTIINAPPTRSALSRSNCLCTRCRADPAS
jgi:DNA-binding PadR family transcriptional regulator